MPIPLFVDKLSFCINRGQSANAPMATGIRFGLVDWSGERFAILLRSNQSDLIRDYWMQRNDSIPNLNHLARGARLDSDRTLDRRILNKQCGGPSTSHRQYFWGREDTDFLGRILSYVHFGSRRHCTETTFILQEILPAKSDPGG